MLTEALLDTLTQVDEVLYEIHRQPIEMQSVLYAEIGTGRHVRHVFDHLEAFLRGIKSGTINYDIRHRKSACEVNPAYATTQLGEIRLQIEKVQLPAIDLTVISEVDCDTKQSLSFRSNADREILYLINHTIHHVAYMRLLLKNHHVILPEHIGIAPSTATFLRQQAGR